MSAARSILKHALLVLSLSLPGLPALAGEADIAFTAGVEAARQGRYQQAIEHFIQARGAGLDSPKLDYNLAVAHYRLGHYQQARQLFLKLTEHQNLRQLAYYNLGLVSNKLGDQRAAREWFDKAATLTDSPRIQALAGQALERLRTPSRPTRRWQGFASAGYLYDSNVTLANDALTGITGVDDTAAEVMIDTGLWLNGSPRAGWLLSLTGYAQQYRSQSGNDFSQLSASLGRHQRLGPWRTRLHARWEESFFGGTDYQRAISLDSRAQRPAGQRRWLQMRYRFSRLQATNSRFDYLDGWRQQLRLGQLWRGKRQLIKLSYQLELNDRRDRRGLTGSFTSFSPTRHALRARLQQRLSPNWQVSLHGRYRYSRYRGENDLAGGLKQRRTDRQIQTGLSLRRKLGRHWEFETRYTYTRNSSSIDTYTYRRHLVTAGINGFF